SFGTKEWNKNAKEFRDSIGNLAKKYAKKRAVDRVPVTLPDGKILHLSSGKHNEVQAAVVEQFRPEFAKDSELLYLGDTEKKDLYSNNKQRQEMGIPLDHIANSQTLFYLTEKRIGSI